MRSTPYILSKREDGKPFTSSPRGTLTYSPKGRRKTLQVLSKKEDGKPFTSSPTGQTENPHVLSKREDGKPIGPLQ
jgi:hypothetical protein